MEENNQNVDQPILQTNKEVKDVNLLSIADGIKRLLLRVWNIFANEHLINGRITRGEYWIASIVLSFGVLIADIIASIGGVLGYLGILIGLAALVYQISLSIRRGHDIGKATRYGLLPFTVVPLLIIGSVVFGFKVIIGIVQGGSFGMVPILIGLILVISLFSMFILIKLYFYEGVKGDNKYGTDRLVEQPIENEWYWYLAVGLVITLSVIGSLMPGGESDSLDQEYDMSIMLTGNITTSTNQLDWFATEEEANMNMKDIIKKTNEDLKKNREENYYTVQIYSGSTRAGLSGSMPEGVIEYNDNIYTFVRQNGIAESFKDMGVVVEDFETSQEATIYLKDLFSQYRFRNELLWKIDDRTNNNSSYIFIMIEQWLADNRLPNLGYSLNGNDYGSFGAEMSAYLPIRIDGEFMYIFSNSKKREAIFGKGGPIIARIAVNFVELQEDELNPNLQKIDPNILSSKGCSVKLYESQNKQMVSSGTVEGVVSYDGKDYTFVRFGGIDNSFRNMGTDIVNLTDEYQVTAYLKRFFSRYKNTYPQLFSEENWYVADSNQLFLLIDGFIRDNKLSYAGYVGYPLGEVTRGQVGDGFFAYLPVRINGKFLTISSHKNVKNNKYSEMGFISHKRGPSDSYLSLGCDS